jgi:hypothetical protein
LIEGKAKKQKMKKRKKKPEETAANSIVSDETGTPEPPPVELGDSRSSEGKFEATVIPNKDIGTIEGPLPISGADLGNGTRREVLVIENEGANMNKATLSDQERDCSKEAEEMLEIPSEVYDSTMKDRLLEPEESTNSNNTGEEALVIPNALTTEEEALPEGDTGTSRIEEETTSTPNDVTRYHPYASSVAVADEQVLVISNEARMKEGRAYAEPEDSQDEVDLTGLDQTPVNCPVEGFAEKVDDPVKRQEEVEGTMEQGEEAVGDEGEVVVEEAVGEDEEVKGIKKLEESDEEYLEDREDYLFAFHEHRDDSEVPEKDDTPAHRRTEHQENDVLFHRREDLDFTSPERGGVHNQHESTGVTEDLEELYVPPSHESPEFLRRDDPGFLRCGDPCYDDAVDAHTRELATCGGQEHKMDYLEGDISASSHRSWEVEGSNYESEEDHSACYERNGYSWSSQEPDRDHNEVTASGSPPPYREQWRHSGADNSLNYDDVDGYSRESYGEENDDEDIVHTRRKMNAELLPPSDSGSGMDRAMHRAEPHGDQDGKKEPREEEDTPGGPRDVLFFMRDKKSLTELSEVCMTSSTHSIVHKY